MSVEHLLINQAFNLIALKYLGEDMNFVSFDFETATSQYPSICEIAFCKWIDGQPTDVAHSLIRPKEGTYVGPGEFAVHGILPQQLENAPLLGDVWAQLDEFIGDLPLVAHNATQDMKKLVSSLSAQGVKIRDLEYYCTLTMARNSNEIFSENGFGLSELAQELGIEWFPISRDSGVVGHSAIVDAKACGELMLRILEPYSGDLNKSLEDLDMRPGLIQGNEFVHGNTKNPKPNPWSSFVNFTPKDFASMQESVSNEGRIFDKSHPFFSKNIVLSLMLDSLSEPEFWHAVALVGGQMKSGISKKVDFLVEGNDSTGRYQKGKTNKSRDAQDLIANGLETLQIIDEVQFLEFLGDEPLRLVLESRV